MRVTKCFLDMDGVIADFVGAVHEAHGRPYCYADHSVRGRFDIEPIWGISVDEFWKTDTLEFWDSIKPTPEAFEIVSMLEKSFGVDNIAILTSPSNGPGCVPGKRSWMRRHFPQFYKQMIFTSAKKFLSGPSRILIDDRDKNIESFHEEGGETILIPRHWNSHHEDSDHVVEWVHEALSL